MKLDLIFFAVVSTSSAFSGKKMVPVRPVFISRHVNGANHQVIVYDLNFSSE